MPVLFATGMLFVDVYESVAAGDTIFSDIGSRPGVAVPMLAGFASGIVAFILGLIAIVKKEERAILVFASTIIGALLIVFLAAEVVLPH
ncbi:hypothetical protein ACFL2D_01570 [Patescibacteria group bacterium]